MTNSDTKFIYAIAGALQYPKKKFLDLVKQHNDGSLPPSHFDLPLTTRTQLICIEKSINDGLVLFDLDKLKNHDIYNQGFAYDIETGAYDNLLVLFRVRTQFFVGQYFDDLQYISCSVPKIVLPVNGLAGLTFTPIKHFFKELRAIDQE